MAVDLPAPENPVMITRSVSVGTASCSSVSGSGSSDWVTSAISFDSDTPNKLDGRGGRAGARIARVSRVGMAVFLVCGAVMGWAGVASAQAPPPHGVNVTVGGVPAGRALPRGFVGVSLEYDAVRRYTG